MRAYLIRRILLFIPTLFLVTVIIFFTVRLIPGDVLDVMLRQNVGFQGSAEQLLETIEDLRHMLGLDLPIHVQYGRWMGNIILHGDFGKSLWTAIPVTYHIGRSFPVSFQLALMAMIVALLVAFPIAMYSAIRQDTWGDYIGRSLAIAFLCIPAFWLGTMVMVYPSIWLDWTPPLEYVPFFENPIANLQIMIIPAFILGTVVSGICMRMTRTTMLEVLREDYIRTSWSKGLKERVVVTRHALRNALIPVVSIIGTQIPFLIGGAVIVEQIFALPGVGRLLVEVISKRDYPVLSGLNLFVASFVLVVNLVVDLTYAYLDPRIRYR